MNKRLLYISHILFLLGALILMIAAYFVIQSIRESFYQRAFDQQYEFKSLEEDGEVYPVQVFHGVKMNTFLEGEPSERIILEVKDDPEAEMKDYVVDPDAKGMSAFANAIQYKVMVNKETGKESFIVALRLTPESQNYRTYNINENGVMKVSNFTIDHKSKMETQWINGLSEHKYGYYTNLPYQKGGTLSLTMLSLIGGLFILGGIGVRRSALGGREHGDGSLASGS